MSVKANELRIGNHVIYNSEIIEVLGISPHCADFAINTKKSWCYLKSIEPITLTEEKLLKCGFEKSDFYDNTYSISIETLNGNHDIFIDVRANVLTFGVCEIAKVKYLHQLQNFVFDLSGKEISFQN